MRRLMGMGLMLMFFTACGGSGPAALLQSQGPALQISVERPGVTITQAGQTLQLDPGSATPLYVGDSMQVDAGAAASLRAGNNSELELFRGAKLTVLDLENGEIGEVWHVSQSQGSGRYQLPAGMTGSVDANYVTISTQGGHFALIQEAQSPLEWVINLSSAIPLSLQTDAGVNGLEPGTARWVSPLDGVGPVLSVEPTVVESWIAAPDSGLTPPSIGQILLPAADQILTPEALPELPALGETLSLDGIDLTLMGEPEGPDPVYRFFDCNQDGSLDLRMLNGVVRLDLRRLPAWVSAVDVTLTNQGMVDGAWDAESLTAINPALLILPDSFTVAQRDAYAMLSLHPMGEIYHFVEIRQDNGCLLGISLTPPSANPQPQRPRAAILEPLCTITIARGLNLRTGPGTEFTPPLRTLPSNTQILALGRNFNASWLLVQEIDGGERGWINAYPGQISCTVALEDLRVAQ